MSPVFQDISFQDPNVSLNVELDLSMTMLTTYVEDVIAHVDHAQVLTSVPHVPTH